MRVVPGSERGIGGGGDALGSGVYELKIDFGPGYRVYFSKERERIVLLLGGSSKKRQSAGITAVQAKFKRRKGGKE